LWEAEFLSKPAGKVVKRVTVEAEDPADATKKARKKAGLWMTVRVRRVGEVEWYRSEDFLNQP
jgi:hypothetical protein